MEGQGVAGTFEKHRMQRAFQGDLFENFRNAM
jgi:hypothetical protein